MKVEFLKMFSFIIILLKVVVLIYLISAYVIKIFEFINYYYKMSISVVKTENYSRLLKFSF